MDLPRRKSTRLKGYDYSSPGAYFITICTQNRNCILGEIVNGCIKLNNLGKIVNSEIRKIESHYTNIKIDKYIIMPNHIHLLIILSEPGGINPSPTIKYDIPDVIGKFKASVTRNVGNAFMHSDKIHIWQRSFHDHIIRGEKDYLKIWQYIDENPLNWEKDCFYNI